MKILCIGSVEDRTNIDKQIQGQTLQPDLTVIYVDPNPVKSDSDILVLDQRRKRIAENHQALRQIVLGNPEYDLIWQVEGDCIFKPDTLSVLVERYQLNTPKTKLGYVSGVQVGRHGIRALGAWHFPSRDEFYSVDHAAKGLVEVDATGFYCLLASREAWLNGQCFWDGERWGPDVNFGLSLREQGYSIYADLDIPVGHKVERGELWPDATSVCNVRFYKDNGRWKYKTI